MGQVEVYKVLCNLKKINNKWYTSKEVVRYMKDNCLNCKNTSGVYKDLLRLAEFRMIECKGVGAWSHHKEFKVR